MGYLGYWCYEVLRVLVLRVLVLWGSLLFRYGIRCFDAGCRFLLRFLSRLCFSVLSLHVNL
jgi:hypothetical protein